jgi:hypothetical protein
MKPGHTALSRFMELHTMQSTNDVAVLLCVPPASVRRVKSQLELIESIHFKRQGTRLLWTPEGVDALSISIHDNPFAGLLGNRTLWAEEIAAA